MEIDNNLLSKFNRYLDEVFEYYRLPTHIYSCTFSYKGETYHINSFNVVPLGYKLSSIDNGSDDGYMTLDSLSQRLDFLKEEYPLLVPFYAFSSYFMQDKIVQKKVKLTKETLVEINENVTFVRYANKHKQYT